MGVEGVIFCSNCFVPSNVASAAFLLVQQLSIRQLAYTRCDSYSRLIAPSSMHPSPSESLFEWLKTISSLAELPKRLALASGPALLSAGQGLLEAQGTSRAKQCAAEASG